MPEEEGGMGAPIHCCGAAGKGNCEPGGCCACERGQASGEEASRFRFQGAGRHMEGAYGASTCWRGPSVLIRAGLGHTVRVGAGGGQGTGTERGRGSARLLEAAVALAGEHRLHLHLRLLLLVQGGHLVLLCELRVPAG